MSSPLAPLTPFAVPPFDDVRTGEPVLRLRACNDLIVGMQPLFLVQRLRSWTVGIGCCLVLGLLSSSGWAAGIGASPAALRHWSFQPIAQVPLPQPKGASWALQPLDLFVLDRLERETLTPAPEADRRTWLRRVSLDLVGLPPTPNQVEAFLQDSSPQAWDHVVDQLLASPRYGERWAQPWLDLVRYADTHGFEVNTERPHAWPYRDYIVRALNHDVPYTRFIREQLAGDVLGEDAATGFLTTAAALLPGQIGQDDASKRLARQDSLHEIVADTGEAFLGLTLGCARCHDHKFDPLSQKDYYAMQAFFAGVEYGDRPIRSQETEARRMQAEALRPQLELVERKLSSFEPLARVGGPAHRETQAQGNEERFDAIEARWLRFTIHDANLHPTLGLIEPCIDEIEVFSAGPNPHNVALASAGARVTASGSRTSDIHRLEHIHDGRYGNSHSWMSDEAGKGWILLELAKPVRIDRFVWSRDREGIFSDRLATAFTVEAGLDLESMHTVAQVLPKRPAVHPKYNSDRFAPVSTRRLRFTITACSSMEPCVDELEVFTTGPQPRNVALAAAGALVRASGTSPGSPLHRLEHLNDGQLGNARSWISNEPGRGWVEVEFPREEQIGQVVWSRDRTGEYTDRLATAYQVEVTDSAGRWHRVASSQDRKSYSPDAKPVSTQSWAGLPPDERKQAEILEQEKNALQSRIQTLTAAPLVFGGIFNKPDVTRILRRGDPEQPGEEVQPAVPVALGGTAFSMGSREQDRRLALAEWITDSSNPLTARVLVNRIWQGHFGTGLVETASDFGINGGRPSHPELLDWLAAELLRSGGSLKQLHRRIVLSATYRQSSRMDPVAQSKDSNGRLLWRFPSRRLEAEAIRDSMLAVNGRLDFKMGGPGFNLFKSRGGLDGFPLIETFEGDGLRRLIYAHKVRMERDAVFGVFDCPDAGQTSPKRRQSTTPLQALNLFNSRFTVDEAEHFAARIRRDCGAGAGERDWTSRAFQLALGRAPSPRERGVVEPVVREHGLTALCRALFNSSEFLTLP